MLLMLGSITVGTIKGRQYWFMAEYQNVKSNCNGIVIIEKSLYGYRQLCWELSKRKMENNTDLVWLNSIIGTTRQS